MFLRDDGEQIPNEILIETEEKLDSIHDDLDKFARENYDLDQIPESVGHYFKSEFNKWLKEKEASGEDLESLEWRKQFYDWYIRWEECDAGCDDLKSQSALSWGQYIDYDFDTRCNIRTYSFLNGRLLLYLI